MTADVPADFSYRVIKRKSCSRRLWVFLSYLVTWWIPPITMRWCGIRRKDVQQAFREKLLICTLIFLAGASMLFVVIGLPMLICPRQNVYNIYELEQHNKLDNKPMVSAYGIVYDITKLAETHVASYFVRDKFQMESVLGLDVSEMFFPASNWDASCPNIPNPGASWDNMLERNVLKFESHRALKDDVPVNYLASMKSMAKGRLVWPMSYVEKSANDPTRRLITMFGQIYDITTAMTAPEPGLFDANMQRIFSSMAGKDATDIMRDLMKQNQYYTMVLNCMNNLFYIGNIDRRNDLRCQVSNYILVSLSLMMALVFLVKFVGACLGARSKSNPDQIFKGVLIQVPCYTEGSDELLATFDSIAKSDYDEAHKLMVVVCDGMVTGDGNDKSTPTTVLELLYDRNPPPPPQPLEYEAIGHGKLGLNRAMVYSGIYELKGFRLPFVVLVKVGMPSETNKAGNRGKRDSQMMLMRFLQRVYSEEPMSPMERELAYHVERTAGKRVREYEFLLFVDADTTIKEPTITKMVSTMIGNSKIIGCCGDTLVANNKSLTTAIQMFEYFISHHFLKAFESWLGSVTCLPGCLCMYRIRTITSNGRAVKPLLVAPKIVNDYAVTVVDTLHKKNLLSLGEDRYLTTLMLKHFPDYKTVFVPDAQCETKVPERWAILLSQRRRWINSTFHNLFELLGLSQLRGCLCFGLRFIILIEFISTMVMPATILYLYYLTFQIIMERELLPIMSLALLGFMYGLQLLISFYKKHPEHIFYMVIYLLATFPFAALSIYLPLYCFWQQDNFSWGDTRIVVNDGKIEEQADDDEADHGAVPREPWDRKTYVPISTAFCGTKTEYDSDDDILSGRPNSQGNFRAANGSSAFHLGLNRAISTDTLGSMGLHFEARGPTLPMPYTPSAFGPLFHTGMSQNMGLTQNVGMPTSVPMSVPMGMPSQRPYGPSPPMSEALYFPSAPPPSMMASSFYRDPDVTSSVSVRHERRKKNRQSSRTANS